MEDSSLPAPLKTAQASIRSFFKPKTPNYAAPPSKVISAADAKTPLVASREIKSNAVSPPTTTITPPPPSPSDSKIDDRASITPFFSAHIPPLKRINALLLCITYPDTFYTTILSSTPSFSRAILWTSPGGSPTLIGGLVSRVEPNGNSTTSTLYIQSLALLSPYRHYGLATSALDDILRAVVANPLPQPITSLYAHVWTENEEGLEWYKKRGFLVEGDAVPGYYRKLTPDTAWVVRRVVGPGDHIRYGTSAASTASANGEAQNGVSPTGPPTSAASEPLRPVPRRVASSFQNARPENEWNDLPTDILLPPPSRNVTPSGSGPGTGATSAVSSRAPSRSSSVAPAKEKKKRQYPAAAFGA